MLENIVESSVNRRDFLRLIAASSVFGCGGDGITSNGITNPIDLDNNEAGSDTFNIFDYLPLEEGNEWTYVVNNGEGERTLRVLSVEEQTDKKIIQINGLFSGIEIYHIKDGSLLLYSTGNPGNMGYMDPPVVKGNTDMWFWEEIVTEFDYYLKFNDWRDIGDGINVVTLLPLEDVKTLAGKFKDCLKIEETSRSEFFNAVERGSSSVETTWFAKGIGKVKITHSIIGTTPERGGYTEFNLKDYKI